MNDFSDGWEDGWNACRKILCKKFDINEEVVIAWENSDKEEMNKGCGKEFNVPKK